MFKAEETNFFRYFFNRGVVMTYSPNWTNCLLSLIVVLLAIFFTSCSTINTVPPEVNLMRVDVQDVTLSHVNLLADLRVFNPNDKALSIHGVDYTIHLEGIRIFSGKSNLSQTIAPREYGHLTLRLSSAYWDIVKILNKLPDRSDVAFSMQGSIRVGGSRLFAQRFTFDKQGVIPLQTTAQ
jgi:LEA14-like dessication related protein